MATDKIVEKILQDAADQASAIKEQSAVQTEELSKKLKDEFEEKKTKLEVQQKQSLKETEDRIRLGTSLEERKMDLAMRREVLDEAFRMAKGRMKNLKDDDWEKIVRGIVLSAVQTDTKYLKPSKNDAKRCKNLLGSLNTQLSGRGLPELKLDKRPAGFEDGFMLIGKYSDVNANFDVLVDNIKESLEWDVTEILFGKQTN